MTTHAVRVSVVPSTWKTNGASLSTTGSSYRRSPLLTDDDVRSLGNSFGLNALSIGHQRSSGHSVVSRCSLIDVQPQSRQVLPDQNSQLRQVASRDWNTSSGTTGNPASTHRVMLPTKFFAISNTPGSSWGAITCFSSPGLYNPGPVRWQVLWAIRPMYAPTTGHCPGSEH